MRLLLTRPRDQSIDMARTLASLGHEVSIAPLLQIVPLRFDSTILENARAIIVTSTNAVPAVAAAAPTPCRIFAVGPDTALALERAGFSDVVFAGGTASDLIDLVSDNWRPSDRPIVYASGEDVSVNISDVLGAKGYDCPRVAVYAAAPIAQLDRSTRDLIGRAKIDAAVFMSVRTAVTFVRLATDSGLADSCRSIVSVSLSSNIADALALLHWKKSVVAPAPTRQGILSAIATLAASHPVEYRPVGTEARR